MTLREMLRAGLEDAPSLQAAGAAVICAIILVSGAVIISQCANDPKPGWQVRVDQIYAAQVQTNELLTEILRRQEAQKK